MRAWTEKLKKDGGSGMLLSVLLHGLLVLLVLWYLSHRPVLTETQLRTLPVAATKLVGHLRDDAEAQRRSG